VQITLYILWHGFNLPVFPVINPVEPDTRYTHPAGVLILANNAYRWWPIVAFIMLPLF